MKDLTQRRLGCASAFIILALAILMMILLVSCTSKSGHLNQSSKNRPEKVVVISYIEQNVYSLHQYKVKRIEQGVVDYIFSPDYYLEGDTIFATFK